MPLSGSLTHVDCQLCFIPKGQYQFIMKSGGLLMSRSWPVPKSFCRLDDSSHSGPDVGPQFLTVPVQKEQQITQSRSATDERRIQEGEPHLPLRNGRLELVKTQWGAEAGENTGDTLRWFQQLRNLFADLRPVC